MIFADLPVGSSIFLDANTFIYHFTAHSVFGPPCAQLLQGIRQHQFAGFTSTHVLSEVAHRLMTTEASARYNWPFAGIVYRLKQNPLEVQKLTVFRQAIDEIPRFGLQILSIPPALIAVAAALSQQTGLLSNDALIVAIMQANGLMNLASEDSDFDRVPGIARYASP